MLAQLEAAAWLWLWGMVLWLLPRSGDFDRQAYGVPRSGDFDRQAYGVAVLLLVIALRLGELCCG